MKNITALLLCFLFFRPMYPQSVLSFQHSEHITAAQYDSQSATAFSFSANPAALPASAGFSAGFYAERKYNIDGLGVASFCLALIGDKNVAGMRLKYFGNPHYSETLLSLNYGKSLERISIGATFGYGLSNIRGFSNQATIHAGIGTVWKLSEKVYSALQIMNPPILKRSGENPASIYKIGFSYRSSDEVYVGMELTKEENAGAQCTAVIYYKLPGQFFARAGFITGTNIPFTGVGWVRKEINIEIIASNHLQLGLSPSVLFIYQKKSRQ